MAESDPNQKTPKEEIKEEMAPTDKLLFLEYSFIFVPETNAWNNLGEFENDLSDFFAANGLECEVLVKIPGNGVKGVMLIRKIEEPEVLQNKKGPQLSSNPSMGKSQKSGPMIRTLTRQLGNKTTLGGKT